MSIVKVNYTRLNYEEHTPILRIKFLRAKMMQSTSTNFLSKIANLEQFNLMIIAIISFKIIFNGFLKSPLAFKCVSNNNNITKTLYIYNKIILRMLYSKKVPKNFLTLLQTMLNYCKIRVL